MPDGGPVESSGALALPDGGRLKDKFSEDLSLSCLLQLRYPGRGAWVPDGGDLQKISFVATVEIFSLLSKAPHPGRGNLRFWAFLPLFSFFLLGFFLGSFLGLFRLV